MADGGGDADFVLRLKQDVAGPAAIAKKAIGGLIGDLGALGSASDKAQAKVDANWKKMMASAKAGMAKEHGAAKQKGLQTTARNEQKAIREQLAFAKQISKDKERASLLAGKQAARNANLQDKADKYTIKKHNFDVDRKQEISHAKMGGFESAALMEGGIEAGVLAIGAAAAAAAAAVGYIGYEFLKNAEAASEFGQSSIKAIGYLTDNAGQAESVFDNVRTEAQGLGLDVEDTVGSFQKLLAAQFSVGQSKELIKMGADMQAIGADAEHVQRILYAMSEIKSMGTLQKRQERMLQMAGISGQLIDQALMKRMNIKTKGGLDMARKKNKIGADVAVEAIKDAVMHKTHESALGQRGKQTADTTIKGMRAEGAAGLENFFINTGKAIEPVLTGLAMHAKELVLEIANDPKLAQLGDFLLLKWEAFGTWVDAHWPGIESMVVTGLHGIVSAVESGFSIWQTTMDYWDDIKMVAEGLAIAFGFLMVIGGLVVAPFIAGAAAIGALFVGMAAFVGYVAENFAGWYDQALSWGGNLITGLVDGIKGGVHWVVEAVEGLAVEAKDAFKSVLHIHSPSKVFEEMGGYMGEGLSVGLDGSQNMVKGSTVDLAGASLDGMAQGSASGSGGGSSAHTVQLVVKCEKGATEQDGERFGAGIMSQINAGIFAVFDGIDIEGAPGDPA